MRDARFALMRRRGDVLVVGVVGVLRQVPVRVHDALEEPLPDVRREHVGREPRERALPVQEEVALLVLDLEPVGGGIAAAAQDASEVPLHAGAVTAPASPAGAGRPLVRRHELLAVEQVSGLRRVVLWNPEACIDLHARDRQVPAHPQPSVRRARVVGDPQLRLVRATGRRQANGQPDLRRSRVVLPGRRHEIDARGRLSGLEVLDRVRVERRRARMLRQDQDGVDHEREVGRLAHDAARRELQLDPRQRDPALRLVVVVPGLDLLGRDAVRQERRVVRDPDSHRLQELLALREEPVGAVRRRGHVHHAGVERRQLLGPLARDADARPLRDGARRRLEGYVRPERHLAPVLRVHEAPGGPVLPPEARVVGERRRGRDGGLEQLGGAVTIQIHRADHLRAVGEARPDLHTPPARVLRTIERHRERAADAHLGAADLDPARPRRRFGPSRQVRVFAKALAHVAPALVPERRGREHDARRGDARADAAPLRGDLRDARGRQVGAGRGRERQAYRARDAPRDGERAGGGGQLDVGLARPARRLEELERREPRRRDPQPDLDGSEGGGAIERQLDRACHGGRARLAVDERREAQVRVAVERVLPVVADDEDAHPGQLDLPGGVGRDTQDDLAGGTEPLGVELVDEGPGGERVPHPEATRHRVAIDAPLERERPRNVRLVREVGAPGAADDRAGELRTEAPAGVARPGGIEGRRPRDAGEDPHVLERGRVDPRRLRHRLHVARRPRAAGAPHLQLVEARRPVRRHESDLQLGDRHRIRERDGGPGAGERELGAAGQLDGEAGAVCLDAPNLDGVVEPEHGLRDPVHRDTGRGVAVRDRPEIRTRRAPQCGWGEAHGRVRVRPAGGRRRGPAARGGAAGEDDDGEHDGRSGHGSSPSHHGATKLAGV